MADGELKTTLITVREMSRCKLGHQKFEDMALDSRTVSQACSEEPENDRRKPHYIKNQNLDSASMLLSLAPLKTMSTEGFSEYPRGFVDGPYVADFLYPLPPNSAYVFDFEDGATG